MKIKTPVPFHWYQSTEVNEVCASMHPLLPPEDTVKSISLPTPLAAIEMTNIPRIKRPEMPPVVQES